MEAFEVLTGKMKPAGYPDQDCFKPPARAQPSWRDQPWELNHSPSALWHAEVLSMIVLQTPSLQDDIIELETTRKRTLRSIVSVIPPEDDTSFGACTTALRNEIEGLRKSVEMLEHACVFPGREMGRGTNKVTDLLHQVTDIETGISRLSGHLFVVGIIAFRAHKESDEGRREILKRDLLAELSRYHDGER